MFPEMENEVDVACDQLLACWLLRSGFKTFSSFIMFYTIETTDDDGSL